MSSRRDFMKKTALVGTGVTLLPNLAFGATSSSKEKLQVALIGVGLRGTNHLNNLLQRKDVVITAICDIDPNRITIAKELISKAKFPAPKVFGKDDYDYRNLLENKDIDAVIISTPWLWHTRMACLLYTSDAADE